MTALSTRSWVALLTIGHFLILLPLLRGAPIGGSSEAREAQVIQVMLRDGEYVLPLRNGLVPSKPPLFHWIGASLTAATGGAVDEFFARLPSLLAATLVLVFVGLSVLRLSTALDFKREAASAHAVFTVGITTLTYGFHGMARTAMVDMVFAACVWAAIYCGLTAAVSERDAERPGSRKYRTLYWFAAGLAVLARGPIGLVLPVLLVGIASWILLGFLRALRFWLRPTFGWFVFLGIAIPWYLFAFGAAGDAFVDRQLFFENLQRIKGGEHVNEEVFWYYIPSLLRSAAPWSLLLVVLLYFERRRGVFDDERKALAHVMPTAMLAAGVLMFSLASGKRHSYLLPLQPLLAWAVTVLAVNRYSTLSESGMANVRKWLGRIAKGFAVLLFVVPIALAIATQPGRLPAAYFEAQAWSARYLFEISMVAAASLALTLTLVKGHSMTRVASAVWVSALSALAIGVFIGDGIKGRLKNFKEIAIDIGERVPSLDALAVIKQERDEFFDPVLFYVNREVTLLSLDSAVPSCREYTLTRSGWFDEKGRKAIEANGFEVQEIARYNDLADSAKGRKDREMILFLCRPRGEEKGGGQGVRA